MFCCFTEFENQQYVKLIEAENQQIAGMIVILYIIKILASLYKYFMHNLD